MKKVFLTFGLILFFFNLKAQEAETPNDLHLIQKILNFYIDGQATGDSAMIAQAFHASWQLKVAYDGKFEEEKKNEYLVGYKKREKPKTWSGRIVSIEITNNIAVAKVEISNSKNLFTDYFNLLKTTEGWFIVDKIATYTPHKIVEVPAKPKE